MMEMSLTTPALLFSAASIILLAYTNRFLALAAVVRDLCDKYETGAHRDAYRLEIFELKRRLTLVRYMQLIGISSLFLSVFSMLAIYIKQMLVGYILFGTSLTMMLVSLGLSVWEVNISIHALRMHIKESMKE